MRRIREREVFEFFSVNFHGAGFDFADRVGYRVGKAYLGQAHLLRMKQNYADAGSDPAGLPEEAAELLVGDPFMNL